MNRAAGERNQRLPQPDWQGFVAIPALTSLPLDGFDLAPDQVRERFRWAASQGKPQWLWPDQQNGSLEEPEWRESGAAAG